MFANWLLTREDYPQRNPLGQSDLVQEGIKTNISLSSNKPGMKTLKSTWWNCLLNHVSAYVGQTCYVVHRLDMETSGLVLLLKILLSYYHLNRLLEKNRSWLLGTYRGRVSKNLSRDKVVVIDDRRKEIVDAKNGQYAEKHISVD